MTMNDTEWDASVVVAVLSFVGVVLAAVFPNLISGIFGRKKVETEREAGLQDRALEALRVTIETLQEENARQAEVLEKQDERNIARMNALAREQDRLGRENSHLRRSLQVVLVHVKQLETQIKDLGGNPPPIPSYQQGDNHAA